MQKMVFLRLFPLFLLLIANLVAANPAQNSIKTSINRIIAQANLPSTVGVEVQSLNTGAVVYTKNSQQLFIPASNLKLFTAAAALLHLHDDFQYKTTLLTDATQIDNGALPGNVYLKFSGNPMLTTQQLNDIIVVLNQDGINTIGGNFYIDNTSDAKPYAPGWMWDELNTCYAAPIQSVMVDQNCFKITLAPANFEGESAKLNVVNGNNLVVIQNQVTTAAVDSDCPLDLTSDNNNNYSLTGCLPLKSESIELKIALKNPELFAKNFIAQNLQTNRIQLRGKILSGTATTANLKLLATQNSESLNFIVTKMMKESNDQIANALLMIIGETYYHQPPSWKNGARAMETLLSQQAGISFANSVIVDGSGTSRYNLISPHQISKLLYFAYHNPAIAQTFMESLPIAGVDGTLEHRMTESSIRGKLRAKTGTMTGVSALSGYVTGVHGKKYSFAILINNFNKQDMQKAERLEDKIGEYLASL